MKKETFVSLINMIEDCKKKSTAFGEAVSNAYQNLGLDKDFAISYAYEFPYDKLSDKIVEIISKEFEDENYSFSTIKDTIDWWIWECGFGKDTYMKVINGKQETKPIAQITLPNGDTYIVETASKLYDLIMIDKKLHQDRNNK